MTIKITLSVSESGFEGTVCGQCVLVEPACGIFGMPSGFPPSAVYELSEELEEGNVLLAEGRRPIYYQRRLAPTNQQIGVERVTTCSDRDLFRKQYLAGLLGRDPQSLSLNPPPSHAIRWTTAEALVAQAKRIRELHSRSFWQLVGELYEEGLLSPEEKEALKPKITFIVHDDRSDKTTPLPNLEPPHSRACEIDCAGSSDSEQLLTTSK